MVPADAGPRPRRRWQRLDILKFGCVTLSLAVTAKFGAGWQMPNFVAKALNTVLGLLHVAPVPATEAIIAAYHLATPAGKLLPAQEVTVAAPIWQAMPAGPAGSDRPTYCQLVGPRFTCPRLLIKGWRPEPSEANRQLLY